MRTLYEHNKLRAAAMRESANEVEMTGEEPWVVTKDGHFIGMLDTSALVRFMRTHHIAGWERFIFPDGEEEVQIDARPVDGTYRVTVDIDTTLLGHCDAKVVGDLLLELFGWDDLTEDEITARFEEQVANARALAAALTREME